MSSYTTFVRNKNLKLEEAFQAIDEAKRILADIEKFSLESAQGKQTDIEKTAAMTHALRNATDRILVGLVESAILPPAQQTQTLRM